MVCLRIPLTHSRFFEQVTWPPSNPRNRSGRAHFTACLWPRSLLLGAEAQHPWLQAYLRAFHETGAPALEVADAVTRFRVM